MLKLNELMMGLNIKKVSSLIRLEGEVRKDGQANGGAYLIMQFNIIYIMRTYVLIRGFWRPGLIMGFLLWPTIPASVAYAVERIRFSTGLQPSSFRCRLHYHCRLLLSDTMMFAQTCEVCACRFPGFRHLAFQRRLTYQQNYQSLVWPPANSADVMDCR